MGMIRITISGSFRERPDKVFSAMNGGHTDAVAQAIEWLSKDVLPAAIRQDHDQAAKGELPALGFGIRPPK